VSDLQDVLHETLQSIRMRYQLLGPWTDENRIGMIEITKSRNECFKGAIFKTIDA